MFDKIGTGELIIILIIALFVIGPNKLPEVARSFGKAIGSARKYLKEVTEDVKEEFKDVSEDLKEVKEDLKEVEKTLKNPLRDDEPKSLPAAADAKAEAKAEEETAQTTESANTEAIEPETQILSETQESGEAAERAASAV
ncbi:MAG: Sec-independent protein translocase protein TatB [Christensenellales bacterium]|jgi:sec-independent protein translocase protein TatB